MRRALACAAVLALAAAASAAARAPAPGRARRRHARSAGVRLGEPAAQVQAALGGSFGVCRGCARPTWYFTYRPFDQQGLGVELTGGRVSAVYTLWQPPGWHGPKGLVLGASEDAVNARLGPAPADRVRGLRRTRPRRGGRAHRVLRPERQALGLRAPPRAGEPLPVIELADVQAAARRLDGVANRTPVVTFADARRPRRRGGPRQGGVLPARRRLQVPRRLQQDRLAAGGRPAQRRRRVLVRQPRAGGGDRGAAARHDGDDPHAGGRAAREGRRDARLRRRDRPVRPLDGAPRGDRRAARRASAGSSSCVRTTTRS